MTGSLGLLLPSSAALQRLWRYGRTPGGVGVGSMDGRVVGTTSTHCNRGGRHPGTRDLTKPSEQTLGAGRQDSCFPFADENEAEFCR